MSVSLATRLHQLPTDWATVTLAQAQDLAALPEGATVQDCLATLLSCPGHELLHLAPAELTRALASVLFLSQPMPEGPDAWPRPASVLLGEVEVPVLWPLEHLSFGQAADIGAALQELGDELPALRLRVLAIILQPAYDGTGYDSDRIEALETLCGALTLAEALPLTDFFLPSSTASAEPTPPTLSSSPSALPSGPPTSGPSVPSGTRWPSWMRWLAATNAPGTTSTASSGPK